MGTAALRGILVALAVALGLLVLARAFPDSNPATGTASVAAEPASSPAAGQPAEGQSPAAPAATGPVKVNGVVIQILNGTEESGLAAKTEKELAPFGYKVVEISNVTSKGTYKKTTLFYRPDSLAAAERLRTDFFPDAKLEPATNNLRKNVQVTVVVGLDQVK